MLGTSVSHFAAWLWSWLAQTPDEPHEIHTQTYWLLGVVLGVAMIINLLVAALAGVVVHLTMNKLGADPALASGTFVTTVTDVVGFFAFLGLATWMLI